MDSSIIIDQLGACTTSLNVSTIIDSAASSTCYINCSAGILYINSAQIGASPSAQKINIAALVDGQIYVEAKELYTSCYTNTGSTANSRLYITADRLYYGVSNGGAGEVVIKRVGNLVTRNVYAIQHSGNALTSLTRFNVENMTFDTAFVSFNNGCYVTAGNGTFEGYIGEVDIPSGAAGGIQFYFNWSSTKPISIHGGTFNLSIITTLGSSYVNINCENLTTSGGSSNGTSTLNIRAMNHIMNGTYATNYSYASQDFSAINLYGQTLTSSGNGASVLRHFSKPTTQLVVDIDLVNFSAISAAPAFYSGSAASGAIVFKGKVITNNQVGIQVDPPSTTTIIEQGLSLITGTATSIVGNGTTPLQIQGILITSSTVGSTSGTTNIGNAAYITNNTAFI